MSKVNVPETIKIGGYNYRIILDPVLNRDRGCNGLLEFQKLTITLDSSINQQVREETVIHEIFEAANDQYQLGLTHPQIQTLGAVLYQIIRDNDLITGD